MEQGMIDATIGVGVLIVVVLSFGFWLASGMEKGSREKTMHSDTKA